MSELSEMQMKLTRLVQATDMLVRGYKVRLESRAKEHDVATWRDRTGDARKFIHATHKVTGRNRWELGLHHGMFYGYYLEMGSGMRKKYPALQTAASELVPKLQDDIDAMIERTLR